MKKFIVNKFNKSQYYRRILFLILDVLVIQISWFFGLFAVYDFTFSEIPHVFIQHILNYTIANTLFTISIFILMKLHITVWKYASTVEIIKIVIACTISSVIQAVLINIFSVNLVKSFPLIYAIVLISLMTLSRFFYRTVRAIKQLIRFSKQDVNYTKIMIIGAGKAGSIIINEFRTSTKIRKKVCCLIDDKKSLRGQYIRGVRVEGGREDIPRLAKKYGIDEIVFAIPSVSIEDKRAILTICKQTNCVLLKLPGIYQLINGDVSVSKLKKVAIEDLLGREPTVAKLEQETNYVKGKVVIVTGGGGSIGSELCRQLASYNPKQLIIVDVYENSTYDIQLELKKEYPNLKLVVLIASVCNEERINDIFKLYKPDVVYHAAAHKHVPLMEDSPCEAIENNVFGTYKTAKAAALHGVEKFILISTDKAVNPTNIMGASKRICEMIIQIFTKRSQTEFVAVRFGNVLGSNGSVIPLFEKQIRDGGPVTVTHPKIVRYFMTIHEAVSLVLLAGAYANGGEIFVLDMGEPVEIVELAKNLIRLSGYKVDEDIKINFTGLRPGEKLYEEMLMSEEGLSKTDNQLIHIAKPIELNDEDFMRRIKKLQTLAVNNSPEIISCVKEIVPEYKAEEKIYTASQEIAATKTYAV